MSDQPLRLAIIGTGGIAHAHAHAIEELLYRADLVAVADVDPARAAEFAEKFSANTWYTDAEQLLREERLDLVHICTPPQTHAPLAEAAMRAGVPSLVEKPTALTLAEVDHLLRVQEETGVAVLTVYQHRFGAAAQHLQQLVRDGALGRPLVATCDTLWFRDPSYFDLPWRGRWDIEGGGPTMGHGIHQFDLLLSVLGDWTEISAFAARQVLPTDTEDVSVAVARFSNGALATVVNSLVSPRETSRLRFDFEYATVEVEHLYGYASSDWTFTPAAGHEHLAEQWSSALRGDTTVSGHGHQIASIVDALTHGTTPAVDLTEARRTLEFAAATYASAFEKRPVAAGEITGGNPFVQSMSGGMVPWPSVKVVPA